MNTQKMHRYIWGWAGLMVAFAATFPLAMVRVSATHKLPQQYLVSESCTSHDKTAKVATSFFGCKSPRQFTR
jgi:hypothetical protein